MKKVLKRVLACLAVLGTQLTTLSAYASGTFNPLYSGILKVSDTVYMNLSEDDAEMVQVIYPVSSTKNKFLSVSGASTFVFSKNEFTASYTGQEGIYTDGNGEKIGDAPNNIIITTRKIKADFILGIIVTNVSIEYNGCTYSK